jgi:hypothetical protein
MSIRNPQSAIRSAMFLAVLCGLCGLCVELPAQQADSPELLQARIRMLESAVARQAAEIETLKRELATRPAAPPASQPASAPAPAAPAYPPQWVESFRLAEAARAAGLADLDRQIQAESAKLRELQSGKAGGLHMGGPGMDASRKASEQAAAALHVRRRELAAATTPSLPPLTQPMLGLAGPLVEARVLVVQVLSGSEMRAKFQISSPGRSEYWQEPVIFRDVDTRGFADGRRLPMPGCFIVTGTERFETAGGGSRTEFVLEPLDEEKWRQAYTAWKRAGSPQQ